MVDNNFLEKNYQSYLDSIKSSLDFETYEIKINEQFYTTKNLKHSYIIDKRNHTVKFSNAAAASLEY